MLQLLTYQQTVGVLFIVLSAMGNDVVYFMVRCSGLGSGSGLGLGLVSVRVRVVVRVRARGWG